MPARTRTDNGAPFAGTGLLGIVEAAARLMKLGIVHERIRATRPRQNGRHERMHRTVKEDTTKPPAASISEVFHFEELGVELITPRLYRVFFRAMEIGELIPKSFASELREERSEPVDECLGLIATVEAYSFSSQL